ncbi:hypothetical protein L1765_11690 [Microaerobacter geothermalis]|uniref:hypothetical protein n=1 Tax=Microaerobacter geothermalis TaxID=674972 RepID=UPI001F256709|nr:hypothetical protein [Microaerobacter geothermalis]MCF6094623.1 hypothetical protein [Microaerobacter geothermalis]
MKKIAMYFYFILSLTVLIYGLLRVPFYSKMPVETTFSWAWLLFAIFVVGAHLSNVLQIDKEEIRRQRLNEEVEDLGKVFIKQTN